MKNVTVIAVLVGLVVVCSAQDSKYTTRYDGIDIDQILTSERLFKNYFNCLMDKGKCTPDGRELKQILPDALRTECKKCSEQQRRGSERVLKFIIDNRPNEWAQLQRKYDPDNVYVRQAQRLGVQV